MRKLVVVTALFFPGLVIAQGLPRFGTAKFGEAAFGVAEPALPVPFMPLLGNHHSRSRAMGCCVLHAK